MLVHRDQLFRACRPCWGSGDAESHFRNVTVTRPESLSDRWPLFNRGVGTRVPPITKGVPIFIHDHFGPGRHAKVISTAAKDLLEDRNDYRAQAGLTSDESRVAEVSDVEWPTLLDPIDDLPPATIVTFVRRDGTQVTVRGISHDNGEIASVMVNGKKADVVASSSGVVRWQITLTNPHDGRLVAAATDEAGNGEQTPHVHLMTAAVSVGSR